MWIQNDLFSRHYTLPVDAINPPPSPNPIKVPPHTIPEHNGAFDDMPKCPFGHGREVDVEEQQQDEPDEPWPDDSDEDDFPGSSSDEDGVDGRNSNGIESATTAESGAEEGLNALKI